MSKVQCPTPSNLDPCLCAETPRVGGNFELILYPIPDTFFHHRTIKIVTFFKSLPSNPKWTIGTIVG